MSSQTEKIKACILAPCKPRETPPVNVFVDVSCYTVLDLSSTNAYLATLTNMDAFGRLRVSNPYTLFEFNSILGKTTYSITEEKSVGATSIADTNNSFVEMSVDQTGEYVIRQSREYIMYQPGKSKLVYLTGVLYTNPNTLNNVTTKIGCFDDTMGIYIQMSNGDISVVKDNNTVTTVTRSNWVDSLDGTGPSGVTVDFSKAQIFMFDFEWLGVGQVRCGIVIAGRLYYYYTFTHANQLVAPYIQMAKLPVRYEIRSTGGSNSMRMICGTVISEGGISPIGKTFTYGNYTSGGIGISGNNPTTVVPLFGLRLRNQQPFNRVTLKIKKVDIANTNTTSVGSWVLLVNPTLRTGSVTWSDYSLTNTSQYATESAVQIGTYSNLSTIDSPTSYQIILSGFYTARDTATLSMTTDELIARFPLGGSINGTTTDEVVLAANVITTSGGDPKLYAFIEWIEIM